MRLSVGILLAAAVAVSCAGLYGLQLKLDAFREGSAGVEEFMFLPDPEQLKTASLGYEALTADLLWLKTVQHMGEFEISSEGYDWIYKALDTVTTLDPQYITPYESGGLILTLMADKAELSNTLLIKGYRYNPGVWQLPFYIGFNYFYFLKKYKTAAMYMSVAANMEGSPKWLPLLASRLYYQAENPAYALEFLVRMYENTKDERIKKEMLVRINELKSAVILRGLQSAVEEYRKRFNKMPRDIGELARTGIIKGVPGDPAGGRFYIDGDGMVRSSRPAEKLGVFSTQP